MLPITKPDQDLREKPTMKTNKFNLYQTLNCYVRADAALVKNQVISSSG